MKTRTPPLAPFLRRPLLAGLLAVASVAFAPALLAQAQFAGTYIGTLNNRITVPVLGTTESSFGFYSATVSTTGAFNLNSGVLTGTVSATGAVTITGGTQFAFFALTSATITGTTLSSNYGPLTAASNNTTQYRLNPSIGFTAASGGGGTVSTWQNGSFEGGPNPRVFCFDVIFSGGGGGKRRGGNEGAP